MGTRIGKVGWIGIVAALATTPVMAQERPPAQAPAPDPDAEAVLPPIVVQGLRPEAAPTSCNDRTGQARLDCLNVVLGEAADNAAPPPQVDVPNVNSAPTALGLANDAATRQRLGTNYGISPFPQPRPTPVFPPSPFVRPPN